MDMLKELTGYTYAELMGLGKKEKPPTGRKLGIRWKHEFYGSVDTETTILPYEYTSETNLRAAGVVFKEMSNEDMELVLRDSGAHVGGTRITSFDVYVPN